MTEHQVEPWLRGPIEGIHPALMPIAHSLMQVAEDLPGIIAGLSRPQLDATPGGAASLTFHLKHIASSLDRLYTYAAGKKLTEEQFKTINKEQEPDDRSAEELLSNTLHAITNALNQLKATDGATLHETRLVGRKGLPSTQLALLYHGAEHCQRHVGAMIATAKVVRTLAP